MRLDLTQAQAKSLRLIIDYATYRQGGSPSELKGSFLEWLSDKPENPKNVLHVLKRLDEEIQRAIDPNTTRTG